MAHELEKLPFTSASALRAWLVIHHDTSPGIWLMIAKKHSGVESVTYDEAVDEALCFGWIDGQKARYDDTYFLQRFTRRAKRSPWSRINTERVARLVAAEKMHPAGVRAVEAAKADGRWEAAYAGQATAAVPDDLRAALDASPAAAALFAELDSANRLRHPVPHRLREEAGDTGEEDRGLRRRSRGGPHPSPAQAAVELLYEVPRGVRHVAVGRIRDVTNVTFLEGLDSGELCETPSSGWSVWRSPQFSSGWGASAPCARTVLRVACERESALVEVRRVRAWLDASEADLVRGLAAEVSFPEQSIAESSKGSLGQASSVMERAATLESTPAIAAALDRGAVTAGHVDAITRAGKTLDPSPA